MSNATIRDVAREASVSVASVSRALNGHSNIRPSLREHIESVATRLGYVPNAAARHLSMARSGAIGVVLPDLHGEFFSELLRGMDREASERGLHLMLMVMHGEAERGITALNTMRGRVDGLVVMAPQVSSDELLQHLPPGLPTVLVNCAPHEARRAELRIDNAAGTAALVDHLVATGRRRMVHIKGPDGNIDAEERLRGAQDACDRAGLSLRVLPGDFNEASGARSVATLLGEGWQGDAILAANDMMAIGAIMALKRAGVSVPERVAVTGFDDIPLARLISPSLTTASIAIADFGAAAVTRLTAVIDSTDHLAVEQVTPIVIARESTQPTITHSNTQNPKNRETGEHA
ncbi:transcriptional regulator, LacI family [Sphingomonas gellani]|uniref:Transcriptional regulator, LacI family n=1 Tax=Sphingomonas gellani TaxID=1166340 RepID=A0A1H7ZG64_9SPHN|nr:LacI family DNA-binding transcriptional regulator [Sphingomonas gellani]SEM56984.1 transcriptional regulator, LacI family [Sphingomonas gellani]